MYGNRQFQSTVVGVDASNMTARALLERFTSAADDNFINYQNTDYDALFQQAQATAMTTQSRQSSTNRWSGT